jgi:hypothetical protein
MRLKRKSEDYDEDDDLEAEEIKEKKAELRKLKMERELLKMQAETEKMRQEIEKTKTDTSASVDSQAMALGAMTASLIKAGVKPEQANEFFSKMNPEALAILSSLTSNNPYLPIFMFLASQSKGQTPQSMTPKDVIELNKSVYELAGSIAGKSKGEGGEVTSIVKSLADMVQNLYQQQLLDKLDEVKNAVGGRSSVWDEILEDDKKFTRFKELFGSGTTNPEVQIQLEQLRQQHELNLKKLDLEMLKLRSELLESRRKSKLFSQSLRKIGEAIGEGVEEASKGPTTAQYTPTTERPVTMKCPKCGADIPNVKPGMQVTCPSCNTTYTVQVKGSAQ